MNYQRTYTYILTILLLPYLSTTLLSQEISINPTKIRFETNLDATKIDEYCYQLTSNKMQSGGGIWYPEAINLKEDFNIDLNIFLGCEDSLGADGMVFMISKKKILGGKGAGMGFLKLKPSIGIEFDTYQNALLGDPKEDHIAVLENGNISHKNQSFQPITISENIEDCKYHPILLQWNAKKHTLSLTLDGKQIFQYKKDIVKEIFKGEHKLYWGLSAATGSDYNSHKVCFDNLEMVPVGIIQQFSKLTEVNLKRGNFVPLDRITFEGSKLTTDISTNIQLEKLVNFLKDNTDKHLDIFGHVHESSNDQDLSMKRARVLKRYLVSKGIKEDRLKSKGLGNQYLRNKLDLRKGLSNTRIEIYLFEPLP